MSITRKEFFRQGLLSLGKTALDVAGTLRGGMPAVQVTATESEQPPEVRPDMVAEIFNDRCLARDCGCFACAERCAPLAVLVVPGKGVRVNETACTGCGNCEYICPVTPKAIILAPRKTV